MKEKWSDITINDYRKIIDISNREFDSDLEKSVGYLSVLLSKPEDELWGLNIMELRGLLDKTDWLFNTEFTFNKHPFKHIMLNGEKYDVCVDITKFSVAQYADFQIYWDHRTEPEYMSKLMTIFIIPKGKKYNEGYDVVELADTLEEYLSITDYNSICFFFLLDLLNLTKAMALYSVWLTRKKRKDPKMQEMLKQLQTLTKRLI